MSKIQSFRVFLNERLTAAAEEIFGVVEQTISGYQEEISRSKEEIERLRRLLRIQNTDQQHLTLTDSPVPEEVHPEQQQCEADWDLFVDDWTPGVRQENPEPTQIKKEQEEPWLGQRPVEEHLHGLESETKKVVLTPDYMESKDQPANRRDIGVYDQEDLTQLSHLFQTKPGESRDKPFHCHFCVKCFSNGSHLTAHMRIHTGERPYRCPLCRKSFVTTSALNRHQTIHSEGKRYRCNYCGKCFKWMESLGRHMRCIHRRENRPI